MGGGLRLGASAAALILLTASLPGTPLASEAGVQVVVEEPAHGATVQGRFDTARLTGVALAGEREKRFDVMLVVDVSGSTKYPSGIDVNGNGILGTRGSHAVPVMPGGRPAPTSPNSDPGDSILAAQLEAARSLLSGLDSATTRVGVVSFSNDARVEYPLSHDYAQIANALEVIGLRGPHGGTNMSAGVTVGRESLHAHRSGAKQVMLLLTDGRPSLPFGLPSEEDPEDTLAVEDAARVARAAGILTNVYGLGPEATNYPVAAKRLAQITGGLYTPVNKPGDIVTILNGVSFANVEEVVATNLTLADMAGPEDIQLRPDGTFTGYVPVRLGKNRIRVSALASDGTRGSTEFEITFKRPKQSVAEQNAELNRIRRRNRELQLLMERERQSAFRRSEKERAVTIEIEDDPDEENQP